MATYSKETALYDTGAIADDIAGAGNTANYYLTTISGTSGISVHNKNDTSNYVNINSTDGMNVVKGGTNVAQFGTTARVGSASSSHFNMNASSLQAYDSNNNKYFEVSSSGITYGSNTVANTSDVSNAVNAVEVYSLDSSYPSVTVDTNGSHPTSLTLSSTYTKGSAAPASYAGRIKVETSTDNTNWTALYTSSSNESSKTITTPTNVEDSEPYVFRQTPSGAGNAVDDSTIVGGTISWNQLARPIQNGGTTPWTVNNTFGTAVFTTNKVVYTITTKNGSQSVVLPNGNGGIPLIKGHKHLVCYYITSTEASAYANMYVMNNQLLSSRSFPANQKTLISYVFESTQETGGNAFFGIYPNLSGGLSVGSVVTIEYPMVIDLTQMFGSNIADYIYSLEQATAGAGVAWFKKLFPNPYYAYNAGELMSVNAIGQKTVGFNQWDEEWEAGTYSGDTGEKVTYNSCIRSKNAIHCFPSTNYYAPQVTGGFYLFYYDANGNYIGNGLARGGIFQTPSNAHQIRFRLDASYGTTYNHDICINISDPSRNGAYEPYNEHTYDLANLTLRGVPKLVNNKVTYDGDTYYSDGTVTRKYGVVDLGKLNWNRTISGSINYFYNQSGTPIPFKQQTYPTDTTLMCEKFVAKSNNNYVGVALSEDNTICYGAGVVCIRCDSYATGDSFKTAMSGVYLVYELATPTTETAQSFTSLKSIDAYGTERYIDGLYEAGTRDVAVPAGHISKYASGVKSIRASLYKAGGTTTLLAQKIIPFTANLGGTALNDASHLESYSIDSYPSVALSIDGATPSALTLSAKRTKGSALEDYSGRINVETSLNNSTWTTEYTSSTDESSVTYNSPANITDNAPYNFRAVPSGVGNVMRDNSIVGGTVAWNQLVSAVRGNFTNSGVTATVSGLTYSFSGTLSSTNPYVAVTTKFSTTPLIVGHKYYYRGCPAGGGLNAYYSDIDGGHVRDYGNGIVFSAQTTNDACNITMYNGVDMSNKTVTYQVIDLTQMFGSTIADYIYSLEQANAGAGVAWFRKLFPKPYYAYNTGELKSVSGLQSHDMTGFNQWDEEWEAGQYNITTGEKEYRSSGIRSKNYIKVVPNASYYFKNAITNNAYVLFYDKSKTFISSVYKNDETFTTPSNCGYITFWIWNATTYSEGICINLAWDNSRNGEYEPYELHSYPLDSDLTLRGIPKLDSANNLYYDGDTYESDGTVTRKCAEDTINITGMYTGGGNASYDFAIFTVAQAWGANATNRMRGEKIYEAFNKGFSDASITTGATLAYDTSSRQWCTAVPKGTSTSQAKAMFDGSKFVHTLATPTTETADPFQSTQVVNNFGTEEYVTTGIPVGHNSTYISGVKAIRASLYKAGGTTTLLAQKIIPCGTDLGSQAIDAAQTATTYITAIDDDGIKVHASNNPNSNYTKIDADGMEVYKGGSNVASFGTETIIRTSDGTELAYFGYGTTAGREGASTTAPFYSFGKAVPPATPFPSWVSGSNYNRGDTIVYNQLAYISTVNKTNDTIIPPNSNSWVRISIHPSVDKGGFSFVTGDGTRALSYASHAEGGNSTNGQGVYNTYTTAAGYSTHAEGEDVIAIGARSHAEGYGTTTEGNGSHAEGITCFARGEASHAEGFATEANGDYSHAQNYITKAAYDYQTVIGKWNNNQSDTAFEIGNGTDVTHLSNAFTVDWKGNVQMYLDSNGTSSADATSGTDKELFNAIRALGWYSDVIV